MTNYAGVLACLLLGACSSGVYQVVPPDPVADKEPPTVTQDAAPTTAPADEDLKIEAHEDDNVDGANGVIASTLLYKLDGETEWTSVLMQSITAPDVWEGIVTGDNVQPPTLTYYLRAVDESGNESCDPADCDKGPYTITVSP